MSDDYLEVNGNNYYTMSKIAFRASINEDREGDSKALFEAMAAALIDIAESLRAIDRRLGPLNQLYPE